MDRACLASTLRTRFGGHHLAAGSSRKAEGGKAGRRGTKRQRHLQARLPGARAVAEYLDDQAHPVQHRHPAAY